MRKCRNLFFVMAGLCMIFGLTNLAIAEVAITAQHNLEAELPISDGAYGIVLALTIENSGTGSLSNVTLELADSSIPLVAGTSNTLNVGNLAPSELINVYWNLESSISLSGSLSTIILNVTGSTDNGDSAEFEVVCKEVAK